MVLRKVDIKDWSSAVAKQFTIHSIPHINLYDGKGQLVYDGGFSAEAVKQAITKAKTAAGK